MNLFELFVKIGVKDDATDKIKDVEKTADKASKGGLANFASKLGGGLKTAAKIGTAALGAAATGITALTTAAIKSYAEYEQLVGGIETLFGAGGKSIEEYAKSVGKSVDEVSEEYDKLISSQEAVMENASNAYRTATMSANEYMSLATSFSASLLQSLEGDTQKAAEYTDRAIIDMSDNASKMGTDIELLKNAYSGFAKGNMTMLDNLKLGYGGTKEEMERLIIDASKMTDIQEKLGITVDASSGSFSNIVNAISVMQESLGISGTTAKEASFTIEGSVNSMKSAWQNLITGIADDNADFETLVNNLVGTLTGTLNEATGEFEGGVINNLFPRIEVALGGIADAIEKLAPIIVEKLPSLLDEILPSLLKAATDSISAIRDIIPSLLQTLLNAVIDNLPLVIETGMTISDTLIKSISENKEKLVDGALNIVTTLINGTLTMLPDILKLGLDLIISLANGITDAIQDDDFIQTIIDVVLQIVETLTDPETLTELLNAGLDLLLAIVEGLLSEESINTLLDAVFTLLENILDFFYDEENIKKVWNIGVKLLTTIVKGLWQFRFKLYEKAWALVGKLKDKFLEIDWLQLGKDIMNSVWEGLKDIWNSVISWFSGESSWFSGWFGDTTDNSFVGGANQNIPYDGSHAGGLSYVPFDGYIAQLHKGERVLTAGEAERYNNGQYNGGSLDANITIGFDDTNLSVNKLARILYPALKVVEQEVYA